MNFEAEMKEKEEINRLSRFYMHFNIYLEGIGDRLTNKLHESIYK